MEEEISSGTEPPKIINVRVEIPAGSKVKYEFDKKRRAMIVDRILHSSVVYPTAYGYIPCTLCEDGDPLDVLLYLSAGINLIPGCIISARPVAVLLMRDERGKDNKIVAIPTEDPRLDEIQSLTTLPKHLLREIEEFFDTYKHLERGKCTEIVGWKDRETAFSIINSAIFQYQEMKKS